MVNYQVVCGSACVCLLYAAVLRCDDAWTAATSYGYFALAAPGATQKDTQREVASIWVRVFTCLLLSVQHLTLAVQVVPLAASTKLVLCIPLCTQVLLMVCQRKVMMRPKYFCCLLFDMSDT